MEAGKMSLDAIKRAMKKARKESANFTFPLAHEFDITEEEAQRVQSHVANPEETQFLSRAAAGYLKLCRAAWKAYHDADAKRGKKVRDGAKEGAQKVLNEKGYTEEQRENIVNDFQKLQSAKLPQGSTHSKEWAYKKLSQKHGLHPGSIKRIIIKAQKG